MAYITWNRLIEKSEKHRKGGIVHIKAKLRPSERFITSDNQSVFPFFGEIYKELHELHQEVALLLNDKKPELLQERLDSRSSIIVATTTMSERLMELYRNPKQLLVIDRRHFEEVVAEIFDGCGYSIKLTARTRDGGQDIIAIGRKDSIRTKYLIECKRPDPGQPIGVGLARQLLGVVEDEKATKGFLVATTYFSPDARALEARNEWRLELKDYGQLLDWIAQYVQLKGL